MKIWKISCTKKQIESAKQVKDVQRMMVLHLWMRWQRVLSERHHLFETAMFCHNKRQFNLLKECFAEWSIRFALESKCKHVIDRRKERTTTMIFTDWFHTSYELRINREAVTHHNYNKMQCVWRKWKSSLVEYQAKNNKADEYYHDKIAPKLLKSTIKSWKIRSAQYKSTKVIVSIVANHYKQHDIGMALKQWIAYKESQVRLRNIWRTIHTKHTLHELNHVFVLWLYQCAVIKHIAHISRHKQMELILNCFASWKVFQRQEKALRAKTSFIRMELRTMPETKLLCEYKLGNIWKNVRSPIFGHFLSWKLSVQETKKRVQNGQIAKDHRRKRIFRRCLTRWQCSFAEIMLIHKAADFHRIILIRFGWMEWKNMHCEKEKLRCLRMRASLFCNKQLLLREIRLWKMYSERKKSLLQKEFILTKLVSDSRIIALLQQWNASANQLRLHRQHTWASYEFRATKLKRHFFVIWFRRYAIDSSLRKREREFMAHKQYKIIHNLFYAWCNLYNNMIYKMDLLESHFNDICNYRLAKYFTLWLSVFHCVSETRERYLVCKIFTDWKHATKRRKHFKQQIINKPYRL